MGYHGSYSSTRVHEEKALVIHLVTSRNECCIRETRALVVIMKLCGSSIVLVSPMGHEIYVAQLSEACEFFLCIC